VAYCLGGPDRKGQYRGSSRTYCLSSPAFRGNLRQIPDFPPFSFPFLSRFQPPETVAHGTTLGSIEDLDLRSPRGLDRSVILRLAGCDWIRNHQVVLITGATGTGKTYLACALAQAACRQGLSSRYLRLTRLIEEIALARADGSYPKLMDRLQKTDCLAIDDFGLAPLNQIERRDLLEVIEDRTGRRATLVTSQLPLEHWHEVVGDATFADAILDRLVHHAHRIPLKGASMRRKEPKTTPTMTVTA
jgi:DNA replication protein DnaC